MATWQASLGLIWDKFSGKSTTLCFRIESPQQCMPLELKISRTMDAGKTLIFSSISATKDGLQATRYKSTDPFYRNDS